MSGPGLVTRQQRFMTLAMGHVEQIGRAHQKQPQVRNIYGGLCHAFPIMVRANGLCQALAFVEAKANAGSSSGQDKDGASGSRAEAYGLVRAHVAAVLDIDNGTLLTRVREAGVADYLRYTRTVLDAWIFYKRFAVSILNVQSAQAAEEGGSGS
jgi:CRISPR-associated protein Cmr5